MTDMAKLTSRANSIVIEGSVERLTERMITAQMKAAKHRPPALRRYCENVVRAAIRRDGHTDAEHRLVLTDAERAEWERANLLED